MRAPLLTVLLLAVAPSAQALPTVDQLFSELGLDESARQRAYSGQMVQVSPSEVNDRDLAVGFVFVVPATPREVGAGFRRSGDFSSDPTIVASHRIDSDADIAAFRLGPYRDEEAKRYLAAAPGDALNLSPDEIERFRRLGGGASPELVEGELRRVLGARYRAYRERGLDGVAAYARGGGQSVSPADEVRKVLTANHLLDTCEGGVRRALLEYPRHRERMEEAYYWIVYAQEGRPAVSLRHRMTIAVGDGLIVSDREFYVSQGHNSTQAMAGLVPSGDGTIVFYTAHISTDKVAGVAAPTKHSIGRKVVARQLAAIFERARHRR